MIRKADINFFLVEHNFILFSHLRDQLLQIASEKEDSIRILKQQLSDTKKVNVDLYEKIRVVEEKCRQFEKELITAKEHHTQVSELKISFHF